MLEVAESSPLTGAAGNQLLFNDDGRSDADEEGGREEKAPRRGSAGSLDPRPPR